MFIEEDVIRIAKLSALELSREEVKEFTQQFSQIMEYFDILNELELPQELSDRDESAMKLSREDVHQPFSLNSAEKLSPYLEKEGFRVPKVIDPK